MRIPILLALCALPLACQSGPSALDFPFEHPDSARALDRRVSRERYDQRVEQLSSRDPAAREEWLSRQLWADGLPVWNRPGEFTVAHIPAIDRSEKDFVALMAADRDAGLILEAAGAWTTAMRAKSLPRPPLLLRFVVCHEESSAFGWLSEEDAPHFRGALLLESALMTGDGTRGVSYRTADAAPAPSEILDALHAGSAAAEEGELAALVRFDPELDLITPLAEQADAERPDLPWITLQTTPGNATALVRTALRTVLQLR